MSVFKHCAGDIWWRTVPLSNDAADKLDAFYRNEALMAFQAGDDAGWDWSRQLLDQLVEARTQQGRWARAGGMAR
jgi:hypothetical protein